MTYPSCYMYLGIAMFVYSTIYHAAAAVYSLHLCREIEALICAHHHAIHDEQICGTNGRTYSDQ